MKSFITRSAIILLLLYGMVFAIGDAYLAHVGAPIWAAVIFAVVVIGIQYLLGPFIVQWIFSIFWDDQGTHLPQANREFIERLCAQRGLPVPRIGIIDSGTPNAFAFGYTPRSARVVVTTGLLEVCTPEEANAVIAHEIGHVEHWDFVVMTIAALAPLLLYQLYAFTDRINNTRVVAYAAYVCYLISQFIVLLLNRTREYYADRYSAEVTQAPAQLASALVKIAYGMVRADGQYRETIQNGEKEDKNYARKAQRLSGALSLMGISNVKSGAALALGIANPEQAAAVMRWDLVNPWARLYELNSTHPLTARRIDELNRAAEQMHQPVEYVLPSDRRVHWGLFPIEFLLWVLPWLASAVLITTWWFPELWAFLGLPLGNKVEPLLMVAVGATWIVRTAFRYHGTFEPTSIGSLIEEVDVSEMRPRAVRLCGEIVGNGLPGAFWSPDLVLRDTTGMLFVLYRPSIPLGRFIFATSAAEECIGQEVEIEGWFRRGLRPYVEMSRLTRADGRKHRVYSRWIQSGLAGIAVVIGLLWLLA